MAPVERNGSGSSIQFGAFTLIPDEQRLLRDGQPVLLTPKAFDLLAMLAANPGRLLTKEQLMQAVWPDTVVEDSNLTYNVFALRKALDDTAENSHYIETVPKRGYRFAAAAITGVTSPSPGLKTRPTDSTPAGSEDPAYDASTASPGLKTRPTDSLNGRWAVAAIGLVVGALAGAGIVLLTTRAPVPPSPRSHKIPPG